ncbi:hypothetical protein AVEN_261838-1 [Araneus ventricosus]|uniref:DDE-1 domain-containing protein n=1 Tax=Araneus ventricosus TaxID=182803 RepID=A0A4Y2HUJ5_ARAVE|nr:hypothetical protein AVEN_261838-1 [Araneus ventricosus]
MTSNIFKEFLLKWTKELKDEKIALLLDNCSAHPVEEELHLKNIKLVFLPPNTTSTIRPLDQGIIRSFKFHYRKTIVQQIIKDIDSHNSSDSLTANKLSKSLSILDSVHTIRNAWDIVSSKTISNCYKKCGLNIADEADNLTKEIIINEEEGMDETFLRHVSIDNFQTSGEKSDFEIPTDIINSKVMSNQEVEESVSVSLSAHAGTCHLTFKPVPIVDHRSPRKFIPYSFQQYLSYICPVKTHVHHFYLFDSSLAANIST